MVATDKATTLTTVEGVILSSETLLGCDRTGDSPLPNRRKGDFKFGNVTWLRHGLMVSVNDLSACDFKFGNVTWLRLGVGVALTTMGLGDFKFGNVTWLRLKRTNAGH